MAHSNHGTGSICGRGLAWFNRASRRVIEGSSHRPATPLTPSNGLDSVDPARGFGGLWEGKGMTRIEFWSAVMGLLAAIVVMFNQMNGRIDRLLAETNRRFGARVPKRPAPLIPPLPVEVEGAFGGHPVPTVLGHGLRGASGSAADGAATATGGKPRSPCSTRDAERRRNILPRFRAR